MKHTFYAMRHIASGELCEVEGNVCYESHAFKSAAIASAKKANASAAKWHGLTVAQYDVVELPKEYNPSPSAYFQLAGVTDEEMNVECERMVNGYLDYFTISGNWHLLMQEDGVYLMFGDEQLIRVWSASWMEPSPERAELQADFIRVSRIIHPRDNSASIEWRSTHYTNKELADNITWMNAVRLKFAGNYFGNI